jgi:hypothetical protein
VTLWFHLYWILKKRSSKLKIRFLTNDVKTLNFLRKNNNLIKIINLYGKISVIGWLEKDNFYDIEF